jgi:hypothetical protein
MVMKSHEVGRGPYYLFDGRHILVEGTLDDVETWLAEKAAKHGH